jgi:transmembrane sensor
MSGGDSPQRHPTSAATRAEAAAWIARLHGPLRDAQVEAACRRWIAGDPERAAAFELLTDTWDKAAQLKLPVPERQRRPLALLATLACVILVAAAIGLYFRADGVSTRVGEQRMLALEDGTRVYLNTDSEVVVQFDHRTRRVELRRGEALFEVAHNPDRPFVVAVGQSQIQALGTAFVVRSDPLQVSVTLVEGSVVVETLRLDPGQRVTFAKNQPARLDRPNLEKMTAWRQGQISLDDARLGDTLLEMNRYSTVHLVTHDPQVAAIRISGVFRAGDTQNFLEAVTRAYHLQSRTEGSEVVLESRP